MKRSNLIGAVLAAVLATQGPLAAVPALAQSQTLNVQGADIRAFIQDVARSTGRTFIVDPGVTGTVTVTSDRPLSRAQLFEVFLSTLRANGLVVTPTASGAYRISPALGAAQGPATVGSERFATEVFQLRNIDATSAAETIRPLVGPQGQVLANPAANSVVVADFSDNLARIRALIGRIDVDRTGFEVVTLQNSSAREIAGVLQSVLAPPGGQAGQGMVTVTPVESSNSIVLRGDPAAMARVRPLIEDLDRRAESADDVQVIFLEHASAEALLPVLQQIVGQPVTTAVDAAVVVSPAGTPAPAPGQRATIARFPGANALVISASADTQRMLADVIRRLDQRRQQVLIEAIVVELSDNAVRELGVQWLLAGEDGSPVGLTNYSDRAASLVPLAGGAAASHMEDDDPLRERLQNLALDTLLGANGFVGGGGGRIGDGLFGFIINAAKTDAGSNLLQTPSLMTLDNEEATILVGQEVPITTGEALLDGNSNPFRTTQRQDIGVKLVVRPQINAGGSITLFLRQEVSSINGVLTNSANDLVLNKRELETTLVVDDGDIAVAGGLLDQNDRLSVDRVPGLGDLPVIGGLFRSTSRQRGRTNLMVFIRPTIIRTPEDAQALAADRWGYMRQQQLNNAPDAEPSLDEMLRDYMRTQPPAAPESRAVITLINPTLPYGFAKRHGVILLEVGDVAVVGLREGADPQALIETRRALGRPLRVEPLDQAAFDRRLSQVYAGDPLGAADGDDLDMPSGLDSLIDDIPAAADLLDTADDAPVIRLINGIIAEAVRAGASDIHLEPFETALTVRMRVDGVLREALSLNPRITPLLVSRIKVMARLDIAEKRIPQDGRIPLTLGGKSLDVRVSTLPSRVGERVVLRILDRDQAELTLDRLGMAPDALDAFRAALREPNGIILVTGPTGSGKTTSLYAGLSLLNDATRNILTVEDPVEYAIDGVGQTQVNPKVGMTFAAGLRAILRQDPDVVMVGEIRDVETAKIAVQAALTGHLVLSTVHTNDAAGAVTRLRDMGVEPFLLASTLRLIVAQRLVRCLCVDCRRSEAADKATARLAGVKTGQRVWRPQGCAACNQTGYVGRVGLYEVIRVDDRVRRLIAAEAEEEAINAVAFAGAETLTQRARALVLEGVTSVEEALRVTRQETAGEADEPIVALVTPGSGREDVA